MLENKSYYNMLFDCYGTLFNETQIEYFREYFHEDLSLSEISENLEVSRAAISKQLKNIKEMLEFYERELGLAKMYDDIDDIVDNIDTMSKDDIKAKLETIGG